MSTLGQVRSAAREASGPGARRRRWALAAFKTLLVVGALYLAWHLASRVAWPELAGRLRSARGTLVAAALLCLLGRFAAVHFRWSLALGKVGIHPPHAIRLLSLASAVLINHVTPTARLLGGVLRARYLRRRVASPFNRLYATVLADQFSHHGVHAALTWVALTVTAWTLERFELAALLAAAPLTLVAAAVLWSRARGPLQSSGLLSWMTRRFAERRERRLGSLLASGRSLLERLREILSDRRLQGRMAALSAAHLLLNATAQWLLFAALGQQISFVTVIAAVALGTGAGFLSGTPGGVGTTEAAMIGCYVLLGLPQVDAAAATLLYRGLHYALVLVLGLPSLVYQESSGSGRGTG